MPFCTNCGKQYPDSAKFCPECGTQVAGVQPQGQEQRKVTYAGEVRKCPACGMELPSMAAICPSCGYELNSQSIHPVIAEFADKLNKCDREIAIEEQIGLIKSTEKKTGWSSWSGWGKFGWLLLNLYTACIPLVFYRIKRSRPHTPATTKKASIIENFQVPNEKAAIIEMLYLTHTKIEGLSAQGSSEENFYWINLWTTKAKYLFDKACQLIPGDKTVSDIYGDSVVKARKVRQIVILKRIAIIAPIAIMYIIAIIGNISQYSRSVQKSTSISLYTGTEVGSSQIFSKIMPDKPKKNGFNRSTNEIYEIGDISVEIPAYYYDYENLREQGLDEYIRVHAETGKSGVMLGVNKSETGYLADSEAEISQYLDRVMNGWLNAFAEEENFKQLDSKNLMIAGMPCKACMFSCNTETKTTTHTMYAANLILWDNETAYILYLWQSDNAEYNYFTDFDKIANSVVRINN